MSTPRFVVVVSYKPGHEKYLAGIEVTLSEQQKDDLGASRISYKNSMALLNEVGSNLNGSPKRLKAAEILSSVFGECGDAVSLDGSDAEGDAVSIENEEFAHSSVISEVFAVVDNDDDKPEEKVNED